MERSLEGEQQQQLDIPELDLRAIPECALVKRPDAGWLLAPMGTRAARSGSPSNLPNHAICWQCGARGRCGPGSRGKAMRGSPALYREPVARWRVAARQAARSLLPGPGGDSPDRKSVSDDVAMCCIPVFYRLVRRPPSFLTLRFFMSGFDGLAILCTLFTFSRFFSSFSLRYVRPLRVVIICLIMVLEHLSTG